MLLAPPKRVVVITGASSGIGRATADRLATDGHHVVLAARRVDRLKEITDQITGAGGQVTGRPVDVTDRAAVTALIDGVVEDFGQLDVVIGNAGVMPLSRLDALRVDEWDWMINVNIGGLLNTIAAVLPHFERQGSGHFVTTASTASREVAPTSAVYSATKYAAWAITEGLRQESDPGIRVTTILPGVTATEITDSVGDPVAQGFVKGLIGVAIAPGAIADAISFAIAQPPDVDVSEIVIRPAAQR
jgi:NADP-dependent 3-hydroxy acid dehydrogenase YdfG